MKKSLVGRLLDPLMLSTLRLFGRKGRPDGVLLVSSRGPAEMVFLSAVLPRFMRLAGDGEPVTLLCRMDSGGMGFLFPPTLRTKRINFNRMEEIGYRWKIFRELWKANYRLAVLLDHVHDDNGEVLVAASGAMGTAAMKGVSTSRKLIRHTVDVGPARQDKILRWSHFADELLDDRQEPQLAVVTEAVLPTPLKLPPTAVLMPFSGVKARQLPVALWREVIQTFPKDWEIRIAGHSMDFERNPEYGILLQMPNVRAETHDFERLSSILRGSRMVIGLDTAALHLAVLLSVPTVCLASAAYVGAGVPYDEQVMPAHVNFLYTEIKCQGCLGKCRFPLENGMFRCVNQLSQEQIVGLVRDILARGTV
ncbi:MAG: glycosyltransferase family 9 protein [Actinomycetota bacterium]